MAKLILKYYDKSENAIVFRDSELVNGILDLYKSVKDEDVTIQVGQSIALMVCRALIKLNIIDYNNVELYYNGENIQVGPDGREHSSYMYNDIFDQSLNVILGWVIIDEDCRNGVDHYYLDVMKSHNV